MLVVIYVQLLKLRNNKSDWRSDFSRQGSWKNNFGILTIEKSFLLIG